MEQLAERLARGDGAAWAQLYKEHKNGVIGLCLAYLYNREDALDAAEEAFVKAMKNAASIQRTGNVRAWLYTIAANTCKDLIRKQKRGRVWLKKWITNNRDNFAAPAPDAIAAQDDKEAGVRAAIAQLEETYRIPLVLRFYDDLDYDEIAEALSQIEGVEVKRGTVASRLNRAKQQLKVILEGTPT